MTTTPSLPTVPDPRVGQLTDLAQGLLHELGEVATAMAAHIPDHGTRDRLVREVEKTVGTSRGRLSRIALGEQR